MIGRFLSFWEGNFSGAVKLQVGIDNVFYHVFVLFQRWDVWNMLVWRIVYGIPPWALYWNIALKDTIHVEAMNRKYQGNVFACSLCTYYPRIIVVQRYGYIHVYWLLRTLFSRIHPKLVVQLNQEISKWECTKSLPVLCKSAVVKRLPSCICCSTLCGPRQLCQCDYPSTDHVGFAHLGFALGLWGWWWHHKVRGKGEFRSGLTEMFWFQGDGTYPTIES